MQGYPLWAHRSFKPELDQGQAAYHNSPARHPTWWHPLEAKHGLTEQRVYTVCFFQVILRFWISLEKVLTLEQETGACGSLGGRTLAEHPFCSNNYIHVGITVEAQVS